MCDGGRDGGQQGRAKAIAPGGQDNQQNEEEERFDGAKIGQQVLTGHEGPQSPLQRLRGYRQQ